MTDLSQLAGLVIATPPASALVTRYGTDYLAAQGLNGDKARRYHVYKSHNAAFESVLINHAAAALVSNNAVNKALDRGVPLRVIDTLPPLPNMPTLVKASLPITFAQQVERALVTMENTVRGHDVLVEVGFPGYISAGVEGYESVRPYKPVSPDFASKTARAR